nr:hypothetical transcript [Hymenolepis microstoma]
MVISIRTNWIQRISHSSHDVLISVGERGNLNRTRRRLQGIDANIRRPCTPPFTSSYSSACRAIRCINSLPVSTIWIKKELIKNNSQAGSVTASVENLESINDFLHQYDFFPDRKYDHKLCTLIPSQSIIVKGDNHKLECNICLLVVKHNRTSILRLELARNRRTANTEFERATNLNSTPRAKSKITSSNPGQAPTHSGETPSASTSNVPSVGANEGNSVFNDVLHSANDKGDEILNRESADEPRRKAAEAAIQRYEQFHRKTD